MKRGRGNWIQDSEILAATYGKGVVFAKQLRRWHREWHETRIPPPSPLIGRHIKRRTLFTDEGVGDFIAPHDFISSLILTKSFIRLWSMFENISTPRCGRFPLVEFVMSLLRYWAPALAHKPCP